MLNIQDQVYITLKIDGKEIDYAHIKDMTLCEGNGVFAPTLKIELDDPTSTLARSHALSEGNTIELLIARSLSDATTKPRKYRVFGPTRENASYNPNLMIIGLLNCPLYFTASARECTNGTSADAIRAIATKVGLTYVGPSNGRTLNDKMIWLDVVTTRAQNVFEITRHGWMDEKSCMESMVTSYHELRYKNIIDEINTPASQIKYLFVHSTLEDPTTGTGKKCYIVKEARDRSSAGVMTAWMNYGSTRSSNHIDGTQRDRKSVDVKTPGAYLAINKEVTDMVKRTRFEYSPIDCSNTHQQYQNALYQNQKLLGLFTETMSLLTLDVTDIQLFDMLIYRQADADPTTKVRNEDIYMLVGKTIVVRGGVHYAERLQCIRMSLTMPGEAPLETCLGGDYAGAPSVVPASSIDLSNAGTSPQTASQLSSIVGSLSQVTSVNGAMSALGGLLPQQATQMLGQLTAMQSVLQSGNIGQIIASMGQMAAPLIQANEQATRVQGQTTQMQSQATSIAANAASIGSQAVALASFTKPNSVLSAIASVLPNLLVLGNLALNATTTVNSSPNQCLMSDEGQYVATSSNSLLSSLLSSSAATADTWNTMLSSISGTQVPQEYRPTSTGQTTNQSQPGFITRLLIQMLMTGNDPVALQKFMAQEITRQPAGQPNWMPSTAFVPQQNTAVDMSVLTKLVSNLG